MNLFVLALLVLVFTIQFALREELVPSRFSYLPELLSGVALLCVAGRFIVTRRLYIERHYLFVLFALAVSMLCAIVWQAPSPGAIISGLRHYLKFFPLLLVPAVFEFTPRQLKMQLVVLGVVLALQPPLAVYQRFFEYASEMHSGDLIVGSLGTAGTMSLLMVGAIAFVTCAYLRGRVGLVVILLATAYLSAPTMINETKIAVLVLPLALLLPLLFTPDRGQALRKMLPLLGCGALTLAAFVAVYDFIAEYNEYNTPLADFLTERAITSYLYTGNDSAMEIGYVSRLDSIVLALERQSQDLVAFVFGLGPGNISLSTIPGFAGEYAHYNVLYGASQTEVSRLLWELGILGVVIFGLLMWFQLKDSLWLSRQQGFFGYFGHAWFVCSVLFIVMFVYLDWLGLDDVSAPFWFFAGVVGAAKARLLAARRVPAARPSQALRAQMARTDVPHPTGPVPRPVVRGG
jgi:hypothetical protein